MRKNEQELFNLMQEEGLEVINVEDMGIQLEGTQVTHAIAMEHWGTKEKCVQLTAGEPEAKHTLYWSSKSDNEEFVKEFEKACETIVRDF